MSKKSFAVLGLGKFGRSVAAELVKCGVDVLAVDKDDERVDEAADFADYVIKADVCDVSTMATLGLSNMDGVVVAITGDVNASVMGTILAKEAGVPYVLAKAQDEVHARILSKVGADRTVIPEKESGVRIARSMASGNFIDFFELSDRIRMIELPPRPEWVGKNLRQLNLRKKARINVVALRRKGELEVGPDPDSPITEDITMIITVDRRDIQKLLD